MTPRWANLGGARQLGRVTTNQRPRGAPFTPELVRTPPHPPGATSPPKTEKWRETEGISRLSRYLFVDSQYGAALLWGRAPEGSSSVDHGPAVGTPGGITPRDGP
jgi:hypothetical protein